LDSLKLALDHPAASAVAAPGAAPRALLAESRWQAPPAIEWRLLAATLRQRQFDAPPPISFFLPFLVQDEMRHVDLAFLRTGEGLRR